MTKKRRVVVAIGLLCLAGVLIIAVYPGKSWIIGFLKIRILKQHPVWSIGIYTGDSPFHLGPPADVSNPVLTHKDVTDVSAVFVADPFMVKSDSRWYMFFEVMNARTFQGDIGLATSEDGFHWTYRQIVLDEPFHLSYPYVFEWKNEYYMIPDNANALRLYKAAPFPTEWMFVKTMLHGRCTDTSILRYKGKWWMFAESSRKRNDTLSLYYADDLMGDWTEHPESPIIKQDPNIARPGGRPLLFDGRIVRFAQDDYPWYGNQVRAFEITELTTAKYEEKELPDSPILTYSGAGWNAGGMHNIDLHRIGGNKWLACVDGRCP